ncbi:APC family permease [Mycoplasmoides pirum]|uniref:APC family permease n=1 Tax=Mycoplasmoides pirum TaxID=2122 RepID=UPI000481A9AC|nr:APC family permease [Mycoplasmoides pirum]
MKVEHARKIGFFSALAMSLGTIIGIGIFFKNIPIIKAQAIENSDMFSFWSGIVSWIIAAVIILCAAISFSKIATNYSSNGGLASWTENLSREVSTTRLGGKMKIQYLGRFVRIQHSAYYLGIFAGVLPFLAVEGLYNAIDIAVNNTPSGQVHFGYIFLGGFIILISLIGINFLSSRGSRSSSYIQNTSMLLKIIPLGIALIIGLSNINQSNILDKNVNDLMNSPIKDLYPTDITKQLIPTTTIFNVKGMFIALPSILFAFDSFTNVGNLPDRVNNPKKTIPIVLVVSIIIASIVYILIAIGAGFTGFGDVGTIFKTLVPDNLANAASIRKGLDITINIFVTISAIGVVNGMSFTLFESCKSLIGSGQIMGWKKLSVLNEKYNNRGTLILILIITCSFNIIIGSVATIVNNDALVDSVTNFPTLFFIPIYAIVLLLGSIQRNRFVRNSKTISFEIITGIAILGFFVVFGYFFFYQYIYEVIANANMDSNSGLFFNSNIGAQKWKNYDDAIVFWVLLAWFISFPFINHFVIKKTGGYKVSFNDAIIEHK